MDPIKLKHLKLSLGDQLPTSQNFSNTLFHFGKSTLESATNFQMKVWLKIEFFSLRKRILVSS